MLERIAYDDPLWEHPPFLDDEALYNLMYRLREAKEGLFLTDRQSVLLARTDSEHAAWVWTSPSASETALASLKAACEAQGVRNVTATQEVASRLLPGGKVAHRLLGNVCPALIPPKGVDGRCDRPTVAEARTVAEMLAGFSQEAEHEAVTPEDRMETANRLIANLDFCVWRTEAGEPAACALLAHRAPRHARINTVFATPSLRGRGYAGAVVAALCERIRAEGRLPMLYTDADYPSSNRCYQKIGFVPVGALVTVKTP